MHIARSHKPILQKAKPANSSSQIDHESYPFFVVGIGASAGGLEALKLFFDHAPDNSGMAFVIVQHLDPTHQSLLADLICSHTNMVVKEIADGDVLEPDHVYVIPPGCGLQISDARLFLTTFQAERAKRRPIDSFFHSLAEDQQAMAIGVVLSGTGTEGTLGLKEIKAAGGITIAQDPATAHFDGMPKSAIDAQIVDFVLPPEKIPGKLIDYVIKKRNNDIRLELESTNLKEKILKEVLTIIHDQTGRDFSNYKTSTISRRISKHAALNRLNTIDEYPEYLRNHRDEVATLCKEFLIGVTSFFRDKEVSKSVEQKILPQLLKKNRNNHQPIRAWVCGCATGEEAYSLAISFKEALLKNNQHLKITIFASDLDDDAIDFARNGIYNESSVANVSKDRLSHYFTPTTNGYQVKKEIREMVVFAHHDLIKDPPFSKMDIVSCRNLLIYINSELQKKIIPVFHYSLNNDGILILGSSESIGEHGDLFSVVDSKKKIFKKKNINIPKSDPLFELSYIQRKSDTEKTGISKSPQKIKHITNIAELLTQQFRSPSVMIDKNDDALYFAGNTSLYLAHPEGVANWNILQIVHDDLRSSLKNLIKKARANKQEVNKDRIKVAGANGSYIVNLQVKPLFTSKYDSGTLMIIFETVQSDHPHSGHNNSLRLSQKVNRLDLENELKTTQNDLQSAIRDLENSNEDLQSANEELQSTNEELETTREELQSLNEELITVNAELTSKIDQLSQSNNDLNNLLRSIEVATVYLDSSLKVKRFTPAAMKIFNLIPSDINRPLTQLSINLNYSTLADDVSLTLKTLEGKNMEVSAPNGTWYFMRILPYRTYENHIDGVLITLVDITSQKLVEQSLAKTNEHLSLVMDNIPAIPYTCTTEPEPKFSFVGSSCEKVTGFPPEQFMGKSSFWMRRIHPDDKKIITRAFASISKTRKADHPFRWKCANGKYKHFINHIRYTTAELGKPANIIGVWEEILSPNPDKKLNI